MKHSLATTALACSLSLTAFGASADTTLVYGSWAPSTDPFSRAFPAFAEQVAAQSGGEIAFETHFDSSVVQMRTVLSAIDDDLVDAGYIAGSVYQAELPIESIIANYSSIESNPWALSAAMTEVLTRDCDDCATQYDRYGIVPLAYGATPHFYLMCRDAIEGFSDLEGKSIRAASGNLSFPPFIGAVPVSTPTVEVFEAMQRGQVECAMGSIFWLQSYSLWDVVDYVLDMPVGQYNNGLILAFNKDRWEDLPDAHREAISASVPAFIAEAAATGTAMAEEVRAASIERGVVWAEPSAEMRETMQAWFASKRDEVAEYGVGLGVEATPQLLEQVEAKTAEWNARVDALGSDKDAFLAALTEALEASAN
ncbi:MAG: TRAP transporter substrate-binding protein DctP [Roseitalea sp.]|jgi:TRAP-type C4-dicarboxylate transport system substrate-binding protein|nr:TRAP transporter substrate-binding protein DctP [Roseitalea sp.]MBO6721346.1 TRAP transporter substrate-binding protein DctP [Roseitalea sp.]MBO6744531.1 TRAP transporter substrate-binding protein DctP [Roseitalea sp.]